MSFNMPRAAAALGLSALLVILHSTFGFAEIPNGFRDIKLGMTKPAVLKLMESGTTHLAFEDRGNEIGEVVRGDAWFRHATYRFDSNGRLVEIGLQIREILGRDRVLKLYNQRTGLNLTPREGASDRKNSVEVRGNLILLKRKSPASSAKRTTKATH